MFAALHRRGLTRSQAGFSFIELVIVVAVIGIITAIAIPLFGGIQSQAKQAAVDTAAQNGYRLALAAQNDLSNASSDGDNNTPAEAIRTLENDTIGLGFLDETGSTIDNPSGTDFCTWAYNKKEIQSNGYSRYEAFAGHCPFDQGQPEDPGTGTPPTPTDPGTEEPEPVDPGTEEPQERANTVLTIRCDTSTIYQTDFKQFTGTQVWSDGENVTDGEPRFGLVRGRTYQVELDGTYAQSRYPSSNDNCLRRIDTWGDGPTESTSLARGGAFAPNLEYVASPPSNITDLSQFFMYSPNFTGSVESWDVSNVTNMNSMFSGAYNFNSPLNGWNVGQVKDMSGMFANARAFNQPLNNWDVRQVESINSMFSGAFVFNQSLNDWKTNSLTDMSFAFHMTNDFNGSIKDWNTSKVTTMASAFSQTPRFNQPLGSWDTSKVEDMTSVFQYAYAFNQNIEDWDVSNVTTMDSMFKSATTFNQPLGEWSVSKVTNMNSMLDDARSLNQNISGWNVANVTSWDNFYTGYTMDETFLPAKFR